MRRYHGAASVSDFSPCDFAAAMITVKYVFRYSAGYTLPAGDSAILAYIRRGAGIGSKIFVRQDYTHKEAEATSMWLNERSAGYPVPASLAHLTGSERNEDRRRPTRRKSGAARK